MPRPAPAREAIPRSHRQRLLLRVLRSPSPDCCGFFAFLGTATLLLHRLMPSS